MPSQIIDSQRAFVVVFKGNAKVIGEHDECFKVVDPELKIRKPSIIVINQWVQTQYKSVPLTKPNLFKRDNYTCLYCNTKLTAKELTIDHIVPRSRGGGDTWENWATACKKCNGEKSDLDVLEWGRPKPNAYRPHFLMMLKNFSGEVPKEWQPYLFT